MTHKIKITLMLAVDENDLIGNGNKLPWHLPADLKHFKNMTLNKMILMGRKTCESLPFALPKRRNMVMTRNKDFKRDGFEILETIYEISSYRNEIKNEVVVIGGAEIYKLFLPIADEVLLTRIHDAFEGDTYFDTSFLSDWIVASKITHKKDEKNKHNYTFYRYIK